MNVCVGLYLSDAFRDFSDLYDELEEIYHELDDNYHESKAFMKKLRQIWVIISLEQDQLTRLVMEQFMENMGWYDPDIF